MFLILKNSTKEKHIFLYLFFVILKKFTQKLLLIAILISKLYIQIWILDFIGSIIQYIISIFQIYAAGMTWDFRRTKRNIILNIKNTLKQILKYLIIFWFNYNIENTIIFLNLN